MVLVACFPAIATLAEQLAGGYQLNLFESGTLLAGGHHQLHGRDLYSGVFAFYGPLAYLYPTVLAWPFSGSGWALLVPDALVTVASGPLSYLLAVRLTGRRHLALAVPAIVALTGGGGARTLVPITCILALTTYCATSKRRWGIAAGSLAALALLWWQDGGAWVTLAAGSCCALAALRRPTRAVAMGLSIWGSAGMAAVLIPAVALMTWRGNLKDWFYYCFVFPNQEYTRRPAFGYIVGLVRSWSGESVASQAYKAAFYLLPYLACAALAVLATGVSAARLARDRTPAAALPCCVLSLYSLLQLRVVLASVDEAKLASVIAPVIIACFVLAIPGPGSQRRRRPSGAAAVVAAMGLLYLGLFAGQRELHRLAHEAWAPSGEGSSVLSGPPIAGAGPPQSSVTEVEAVVGYLRSHSTQTQSVLVLPNQPMFYFLADRANPTRFDYLDPSYIHAGEDQSIVDDLERAVPSVIVLADSRFADTRLSGRDIAPRTYRWIETHYRLDAQFGPFQVLLPTHNGGTAG